MKEYTMPESEYNRVAGELEKRFLNSAEILDIYHTKRERRVRVVFSAPVDDISRVLGELDVRNWRSF